MRETLGARWTAGIVLRYGALYGLGTSMAPGGEQFELVCRRVVVHPRPDAAEATVAAVAHGSCGVYNVVDDDPALGRSFLILSLVGPAELGFRW